MCDIPSGLKLSIFRLERSQSLSLGEGSRRTQRRRFRVQARILNASTISEIDAAFATIARERLDALFVAPDGFYYNSAAQFVALAARGKIPATYDTPHFVEAGGLMSYGTDFADMFHQIGVYTGTILKGARLADLPVVQSTKFELVINLKTAKAIGHEVPAGLVARADKVIE
jgi:putative ABC transport system substrate-binding protein